MQVVRYIALTTRQEWKKVRQSTRLITNSALVYARMVVTVGIGLITVRLLVDVLGVTDFGLLAVLGASGSLLLVVTDAMTLSAQRYLAYEVGQGDDRRLRRFFNTVFLIFCVAGVVVALLGGAIAPFVSRLLDVPPNRSAAAGWVFFLTAINMSFSAFTTPYRAITLGYQMFPLIVVEQLAASVMTLMAVLLVFVLPGDPLIDYALLLSCVTALHSVILVSLTLWRIPASRPRRTRVGWRDIKQLLSFASWTFVGTIAWRIRVQGSQVLLNVMFGPAINAAYAVATRVGGYQNNLGITIQKTAQPAVVVLEAKQNHKQKVDVALLSSKYRVLASLFLAVPLWFEMNGVLHAWLTTVPPMTVIFSDLVMAWMLLDGFTGGHDLMIQATGKIAGYESLVGAGNITAILLAALWIWQGGPAWTLPLTTLGVMLVTSVARAFYAGRRTDVSLCEWCKRTVWPTFLVGGLGAVTTGVCHFTMADGVPRILVVFATYGATGLLATWFLALEPMERGYYRNMLRIGLSWLMAKRRSHDSG